MSESRFPVTAEQGQIASCQSSTDSAGQFERRGAIANNVLNPLTYVAVAIVECAIVVAASVAPAPRAARVGPLAALREM